MIRELRACVEVARGKLRCHTRVSARRGRLDRVPGWSQNEPMSRELAYLLLICSLMVVPGLLQRLRVPPPLTCFLLGLALIMVVPDMHRHDDAVHLLSALGISTLFLYAGLEVDL